jgi:outer membrane cobalamin receptor
MFTSRLAWLGHAACLLFLCSIPLFSQSSPTVSGCVEDQTHSAIRGAIVSLAGSDRATRIQTQTDEKGCFAIVAPAGKYHLRILAEAFSPFEKDVAVEGALPVEDIVLQIRPVEATAVVTATRSLASTSDVASNVDVIDREQIDASHIESTADLLRNVVGADIVQTGNRGGISSLFLRGGNSNQTKILMDGVPLNQPGGTYDFAHLATDNVSRMEIVRGPQSSLYGSDAMAGVVQIFTRRGTGSPEGEYAIEGGNYSTLKESAAARGSWRKFDWSNTFSRLDTDNIEPNNDYRNSSYFGNFGFTPGAGQTLRGTLFHTSSRVGTPGYNAPGFTSFGPNDHATNLERAAGLTYQALVGSRLTQHFGYSYYDHNYNYFSSFGVSQIAHTRHHGEYRGDLATPSAGTLTYGMDFDRESGTVAGADHIRNNSGWYVQQQFEAWSRLNVSVGGRLENNTTFGTRANPKVGLSFKAMPGTRLRFAAGSGMTEPSYTENFSTSVFFLGNSNLAPERSRSWETGVEQSFLNNRMTADLTWFDNRVQNWIQLVSNPDFTAKYQNIGRIRARGLETRVRARVNRLSVQANYAYLDGQVEQSSQSSFPYRPGDPLIRRPKHSGDLVLTWIERKWTARWGTRAVGRRADSDFFAYAIPNSLTSNPGYSVSDATFTYDFARPISAFIRLDNIFNRDYQEVLGYLALRRSVVVGTRIRIGGAR